MTETMILEKENELDSAAVLKRSRISRKYTGIEPAVEENKEAGLGRCFIGKQGKGREDLIKVDKAPGKQSAEVQKARGCDIKREVEIAKDLDPYEAYEHGLIITSDYEEVDGLTISAQPRFKGGESLSRFVRSGNKKIRKQDLIDIISPEIDAAIYLKSNGVYHRDISPHNVLVRKKGKRLEAKVVDLTNATRTNDLHAGYMPTAGARIVRDPLLFFTRKPSIYDDAAEIYAIAQNILITLNGKPGVEYDHYEGLGIDATTNESVLGADGDLDTEKHDAAIQRAIASLPKWARKKYGKMIFKAMRADKSQRYKRLEEFRSDFYRASKPGFFSRLMHERTGQIATAALAGVLAIGSVVGYGSAAHFTDKIKTAQEEAAKFDEFTSFDERKLDVSTNWVELAPSIDYCVDRKFSGRVYHRGLQAKFIRVENGGRLCIVPNVYARPVPNKHRFNSGSLNGRVYIQGFGEIKEFITPILDLEIDNTEFDWRLSAQIPYISVPIDNLPTGNYNLVIEVDSPEKTPPLENVINDYNRDNYIRFSNRGKVLDQTRVHLVVGNITPTGVETCNLKYKSRITYYTLDNDYSDEIDKQVNYKVIVPEMDYEYQYTDEDPSVKNSCGRNIELPEPKDNKPKTLIFATEKNGKLIAYTAFPIAPITSEYKNHRASNNFIWYEHAIPGPDFAQKVKTYREQYFSDANDCSSQR